MKTTQISPTLCPWCGYAIDSASPAFKKDAVPEVGDFTMCVNCGEIGRYGVGFVIEKTTDEDLYNHIDGVQFVKLVLARKAVRKRGPLPSQQNRKPS